MIGKRHLDHWHVRRHALAGKLGSVDVAVGTGWRFVCGCEGVGVLWGFLVCEGVRVFLCVLVLV